MYKKSPMEKQTNQFHEVVVPIIFVVLADDIDFQFERESNHNESYYKQNWKQLTLTSSSTTSNFSSSSLFLFLSGDDVDGSP